MLLPALGKARAKARSISCCSNLKQIGTMAFMYIHDNNDFFPHFGASWANWMVYKYYCITKPTTNFDVEKEWVCPSAPQHQQVNYAANFFIGRNYWIENSKDEWRAVKIDRITDPSRIISVIDGAYMDDPTAGYNRDADCQSTLSDGWDTRARENFSAGMYSFAPRHDGCANYVAVGGNVINNMKASLLATGQNSDTRYYWYSGWYK